MNPSGNLKQIVEAALLASGKAMSLDKLQGLFDEMERPEKKSLRAVLKQLSEDYADRGIEVKEVASGWRIQVSRECAPWVSRLWEEKPSRYSRALMETLALIAYRQPITRGEIEDIRGVSVSTHIMRTLLEREWVRVVGQRDVPGKPSLYGTTREFLDYFGLKSLDELPTLAEIRDLDVINEELNLQDPDGIAADKAANTLQQESSANDQRRSAEEAVAGATPGERSSATEQDQPTT
ncbi:MAG TPA: SMC-Scp complex subunit ScpB, partial [Thiolapillus brandeum]|nr:SMC-Scp complex subunit ScpB [Thiolapillus brandeum]